MPAEGTSESRARSYFQLAQTKNKVRGIEDQLPAIFHNEEPPSQKIHSPLRDGFARYRDTLPNSVQPLLDRYELKNAAIKVGGVGSVGTKSAVFLLMAGEGNPLFLEVKEARASVLAPYAGASVFSNQGQRIIDGHRLMQPATPFLGWTRAARPRHILRHCGLKVTSAWDTSAHEMDLRTDGRALARLTPGTATRLCKRLTG